MPFLYTDSCQLNNPWTLQDPRTCRGQLTDTENPKRHIDCAVKLKLCGLIEERAGFAPGELVQLLTEEDAQVDQLLHPAYAQPTQLIPPYVKRSSTLRSPCGGVKASGNFYSWTSQTGALPHSEWVKRASHAFSVLPKLILFTHKPITCKSSVLDTCSMKFCDWISEWMLLRGVLKNTACFLFHVCNGRKWSPWDTQGSHWPRCGGCWDVREGWPSLTIWLLGPTGLVRRNIAKLAEKIDVFVEKHILYKTSRTTFGP